MSEIHHLCELVQLAAYDDASMVGGYPDEVGIVSGHLVVAGHKGDTDAPELRIYPPQFCRVWYWGIRQMKKKHPKEDVSFWVNEGMPPQKAGAK